MKKRKKLSSLIKLVISISVFLILMDVGLGIFFMVSSVNRSKGIIRAKMTETAVSASKLLNGDEIKALTIADKENETEPYKRNYDILASFKTSAESNNAELAFIYCLVKTEDNKSKMTYRLAD